MKKYKNTVLNIKCTFEAYYKMIIKFKNIQNS